MANRPRIVTLRLSDPEYEHILSIAQQSGISISACLRAIIKKIVPTLGNTNFYNYREEDYINTTSIELLELDPYEKRKFNIAANELHQQLMKLNKKKPLKKPYILIADDESIHQELIPKLLKESLKKKVYFDTASNGHEALRKIEKNQPILLILDLIMPELDGYEVLKRLNKQTNLFPIIIASAYVAEKNEIAIRGKIDINKIQFIKKPYPIKELHDIVSKTLSKQSEFLC